MQPNLRKAFCFRAGAREGRGTRFVKGTWKAPSASDQDCHVSSQVGCALITGFWKEETSKKLQKSWQGPRRFGFL